MTDHRAEPDGKTITLHGGRTGPGTRWSHCVTCGKRISETVRKYHGVPVYGWRHAQ